MRPVIQVREELIGHDRPQLRPAGHAGRPVSSGNLRLTRATVDHLDFFELVYAPGAQSHPRQYTHPGTEMVVMTTGHMGITAGFETCQLAPGDSLCLPSTMPHRYISPGAETARAVTVILYGCPSATPSAAP